MGIISQVPLISWVEFLAMFILFVLFFFGSHDIILHVSWPEHKALKTHAAYIFLRWNQRQRV